MTEKRDEKSDIFIPFVYNIPTPSHKQIVMNHKELEKSKIYVISQMVEYISNSVISERLSWKTTICSFYDEILSLLTPLINICKVEFDFIEKYTPKIFNDITADIIKDIPKNYTLKEAREYEQQYLKILTDYSYESSKKGNLWDGLLHILSGDMYQLPSERVILKRWMNRKMKEEFSK